MKILFLDCETSDISPLNGQIIEIGGVIAELNPQTLQLIVLDQFESLIRIRKNFDDKITRITGITEVDLLTAKTIVEAQELWANWLDKYEKEVVAICGHSVDFDLGFLKSESWFLPENASIIDTLPLSKILFTQFSAVNLEFLIEKLDLLNFLHNANHKITTIDGQAHRALFDTWCSAGLLQHCLIYLKNISFSQNFYQFLVQEILPLDLTFYESTTSLKPPFASKTLDKVYLDLSGEIIPISTLEKFNQFCLIAQQPELSILESILHSPLSFDLKIIVASFYTSILLKNQNPEWFVKLHIHTNFEKIFTEILLDYLNPTNTEIKTEEKLSYKFRQFENILWQIKQFSEEVIDIGKLILYLEIYQKLNPHIPNSQIQNFLSEYDFFLVAMEFYWASNYYQYWYKPKEILGAETIVKTKFSNLLNSLDHLELPQINSDLLSEKVRLKIADLLAYFRVLKISPHKNYHFRMVNQKFVISFPKPDFYLPDLFEKNFIKYPNLSIETYLRPEKLQTLLNCAGLLPIVERYKIKIDYLNPDICPYKIQTTENLLEMLQNRQKVALEKQIPVLILTGNNLSLKKVQKILAENFKSNDYLILGESGSLTKVCSKIAKGFVGLVNVRIGDFAFVNAQTNLPKFAEIWLVGRPFIFVQTYWQNLSKENSEPQLYIHTLQDLNLQAQTGFIFHQTGQIVNYFPLN